MYVLRNTKTLHVLGLLLLQSWSMRFQFATVTRVSNSCIHMKPDKIGSLVHQHWTPCIDGGSSSKVPPCQAEIPFLDYNLCFRSVGVCHDWLLLWLHMDSGFLFLFIYFLPVAYFVVWHPVFSVFSSLCDWLLHPSFTCPILPLPPSVF